MTSTYFLNMQTGCCVCGEPVVGFTVRGEQLSYFRKCQKTENGLKLQKNFLNNEIWTRKACILVVRSQTLGSNSGFTKY